MPEPRGPVITTPKADVGKESTSQTQGMVRKSAVVDKSPSICGTMMYAEPHSGSAIHHHGDQDTIVYAVRGHGALVSDGGKKRQPLEPGDWALIPAFAEHQEINDGEEELEWVIVRAPYGVPIVKNLDGWGGKEVDA